MIFFPLNFRYLLFYLSVCLCKVEVVNLVSFFLSFSPTLCSEWVTSMSLQRPRWASSALHVWPKWSCEWPAGASRIVTLSPNLTRAWCWRCSRMASGLRYCHLKRNCDRRGEEAASVHLPICWKCLSHNY